ncbi:MAG: hypothetical protein HPY66_0268 [Firmicutes bacterium]|nr:hypothetical protein [Bacillota bacterium]MDI6704690.1 PilZ domain-containing protein [Bacillota bacterium]
MKIPARIGEKLGILVLDDNGEEKSYLISQLLDTIDDEIMEIAMPISEGRLIPLHINSRIKVIYYKDNGQYCFLAKILSRRKGDIHILRIQALSDVEKIQRRDYFRLNTVVPIKVCYDDSKEENGYRCIDTFTLDISGGGLRFASKHNFSGVDSLVCQLNIRDKILSVNARIIRNSAVYNEDYSFEVGVEFINIEQKIREEIINYIFDEQRRLMRKGMI